MGPPMLLNIHDWDKPERHRQAVWFASAVCHGDYFLFDNEPLMDFVDQPKRPEVLGFSSQTNFACLFTTPEEKDRIRRVLAVCLFSKLIPLFYYQSHTHSLPLFHSICCQFAQHHPFFYHRQDPH